MTGGQANRRVGGQGGRRKQRLWRREVPRGEISGGYGNRGRNHGEKSNSFLTEIFSNSQFL